LPVLDNVDDPLHPLVHQRVPEIALQLAQAADAAQVRQAALQIESLVAPLHQGGLPVERIAQQVCELNAQVFARLWSLLAPAELVRRSCLVVMGSEGRQEQVFKTDQDNALLLPDDGGDPAALEPLAQRFISALIDCGYPRCPGNIMLSNPLWRQPVAGFRQSLREWMFGADPRGPMHLAIFLDAAPVAGDAALLQQARSFVQQHVVDNDAFFARFARAADQFNEPGGWWQRLGLVRKRDEPLFDLKKLGTFPIVHGVRALALQHHVAAVPTTERLRALVNGGHLPAGTADALTEALHLLMALKLEHNLAQRQRGELLDNLLHPAALSEPQRERLQAALDTVKRFRRYLREHFKLDSL
jgi:CBS domain-containing protein